MSQLISSIGELRGTVGKLLVRTAFASATVLMMLAPSSLVLADHYGFFGNYYNTYIIGWNTENGFNSGEALFDCGGAHWRNFSRVNLYGYSSYEDPYINWVQLYDGVTIGSSSWVYGTSYVVSDKTNIPVESFLQSFYTSRYYYLFSSIDSDNGDLALFIQRGDDPDSYCNNPSYHILDRVG